MRAAVELLREGRPPSMPEAAERALVSVATAYRYFTSAEELWVEASAEAVQFEPARLEADRLIDAAGDDVPARLEAWIRSVGFAMLEDQAPYRQMARAALERWFAQLEVPVDQRTPVREGRRGHYTSRVVEPLRDRLSGDDVDRLVAALGVVVGTDGMLALTDGVGLDDERARAVWLDAARWMLAGALAELDPPDGRCV